MTHQFHSCVCTENSWKQVLKQKLEHMCIAKPFPVAKWKQPKCPSTGERNVVHPIQWNIQPQEGRKLWYVLRRGWNLKTLCYVNDAKHKRTHYMIWFTWNVQTRQIQRDKKQIVGRQVLREGDLGSECPVGSVMEVMKVAADAHYGCTKGHAW